MQRVEEYINVLSIIYYAWIGKGCVTIISHIEINFKS